MGKLPMQSSLKFNTLSCTVERGPVAMKINLYDALLLCCVDCRVEKYGTIVFYESFFWWINFLEKLEQFLLVNSIGRPLFQLRVGH